MGVITRRTFLKSSAAAGVTASSWNRILGANDAVRVAVVGFNGRGKTRERGADHSLAMFGFLDQRPELLEKCSGVRGRLVHLPIARHDWFSHTICGRKLSP